MIRTNMYFPKHLYQTLKSFAQEERMSIAELVRKFVVTGLKEKQKKAHKKPSLAKVLLDLAEQAKKEGWGKGAPRDLSTNHNKYFVEAWEENYKKRQK